VNERAVRVTSLRLSRGGLRQPGLSTSFKKVDEGQVRKSFYFQFSGHWCVALGIWWDTRSCVLPDRSPRMCVHPRLPDD